MTMAASVKITVLRQVLNDFAVEYKDPPGKLGPCQWNQAGREFLVQAPNVNIPLEFCSWAWADIQKYVMALARGANFIGSPPGVFVTCCTDGYRPVIFKLERIKNPKNIKATKQ